MIVVVAMGCGEDRRSPESDTGSFSNGGLPCDVRAMLAQRCQGCHGNPPVEGVPMSLVSYDDLIQPMADDATLVVERALARMKNVSMPMPPSPNAAATTGEIAILESWIAAGLPPGDCGGGGPFDTPPTCSSGVMWTGGDSESELMHPGAACISCHGSEMQIAGTVYPTAHEPTECNGAGNAVVEVTDANATVFALPVNSAGNFYYDGVDQVVFPITAKVIVGGAERVMMSAQTSGDCNECHTQTGTNMAPGRIVLP